MTIGARWTAFGLWFAAAALGCTVSGTAPERVATATATAALTTPVNLVGDPSFEGQGGTLGDPWQGSATIESGTVPTPAARGQQDALVQADSGWNPVQQWIPVKPFTHYTASAAVQTSGNLDDAYFSVRSGTTWQVLNQAHFGALGSSAYRTLRFEFDSDYDTSALLYLGFWANTPGTWLRVDDVNVLEAPSVVTDGAFEGTTGGWQITGTSWIDYEYPHTGSSALVLSGSSGWTSVNQWIPVAANTRYRAGAWVSTSATVDGWFSVRGGSSFDVINQVHYGAVTGGYQWLTFDFDSGANTSVLLYAGFWGPGTTSSVEIDDVTVTSAAPLRGNYGYGNYGYVAHYAVSDPIPDPDFACDWTGDPAYACDPENEQTARDLIDTMVAKFHVTDVQFYDWMFSYEAPTPTSGTHWTDAYTHVHPICLQTLQWYIDELHRDGARAWAYVQSVASETFGLGDPEVSCPSSPMECATAFSGIVPACIGGRPQCMSGTGGVCSGKSGEHPLYFDNAAWADHQVATWAPGVAALGFDGIHWDTLGPLAPSGDPCAAQEAPGVKAFLQRAATQLAPYHLMQTMNFVGVNTDWWDDSLLGSVSFLYAEAWSLDDARRLFRLMDDSTEMQARGGVLPFYPSTLDVPDGMNTVPDDQQESVMLARWSAASQHLARYLVVGDGARRLRTAYFPCDLPLSGGALLDLSQD